MDRDESVGPDDPDAGPAPTLPGQTFEGSLVRCPWCGTEPPLDRHKSRHPADCPRCHRGVKTDWHYCAWCYGPGFEVETTRRYDDKRYSTRCQNEKCRGPLMPFMRYCPWCRVKTKRPWKLPGSSTRCPHCRWGVDTNFWHYCPWCTKALEA